MKLTLDGKEIDTAKFSAETLSDLIRKLESMISPERVIVSMILDGKPLDQKGEKASSAEKIVGLESLEVQTSNVHELARNTLDSLIEYLPGLIDIVNECLMLFQGEDESEGHRHLEVLIDGLQITSSAWNGIAFFLTSASGKQEQMLPSMVEFNEILRSILQAQEKSDTVLICDIMELKLVPLLESWLEKAIGFRNLINSTA